MVNTRGYTYLLHNGTHYKIGITAGTVTKRVVELQTGSPTKIEISGYSYNKNALEMEQWLHTKFHSKRLEGEWFALNDDDVAIVHHHFETHYLDEYMAPLSKKGIEATKNREKEEAYILNLVKRLARVKLMFYSIYRNKEMIPKKEEIVEEIRQKDYGILALKSVIKVNIDHTRQAIAEKAEEKKADAERKRLWELDAPKREAERKKAEEKKAEELRLLIIEDKKHKAELLKIRLERYAKEDAERISEDAIKGVPPERC